MASGTADVVATADGVRASAPITVELPARADPPPDPPPGNAEFGQEEAAALAQQCLAALTGGRERISAVFAENDARNKLISLLAQPGATVNATLRGMQVNEGRAEFTAEAKARDAFGRGQTQKLAITALARREGSRWALEGCRLR